MNPDQASHLSRIATAKGADARGVRGDVYTDSAAERWLVTRGLIEVFVPPAPFVKADGRKFARVTDVGLIRYTEIITSGIQTLATVIERVGDTKGHSGTPSQLSEDEGKSR